MFGRTRESQRTLEISASTRPKRIAFLADLTRISNEEIDEIIRYNARCWGGRFNPMIHCTGLDIEPNWWSMLVTLDPDIIYSFLRLSDEFVHRINRTILPARIIEPPKNGDETKPDQHSFHPFDIKALDIQGIPTFAWTRRSGFQDPFFLYIKESPKNIQEERFALRNFGTLPEYLPYHVMFEDVPHQVIEIKEDAIAELIGSTFLYPSKAAVYPMDLCRYYSSKSYSLPHTTNVPGFHLVVGDTPWEAIYLWNLALQERPVAGRDSFWLPSNALDDEDILDQSCEWINRKYWGEQSHRELKLISYSVPTSELDRLSISLPKKLRMNVQCERLLPGSHPFPGTFENPSSAVRSGFGVDQLEIRRTEQTPVFGNSAIMPIPQPPFVKRQASQTGWMVDLTIEHTPELYTYTNIQPIWMLPKRQGVARLFAQGSYHGARINSCRLPSVEVEHGSETVKISIPEDRTVIWSALLDHGIENTRQKHEQHKSIFERISTSDKGRYVNGLLQLFGSLFHANTFFEDPYWRAISFDLAGRSKYEALAAGRIREARDSLVEFAEKVRAGTESSGIDELLGITLRSARPSNSGLVAYSLKQLKGKFYDIRGKGMRGTDEGNYWRVHEKFDSRRERDVSEFLWSNILIQGVFVRCYNCFTTQWIMVDDVGATIICSGYLSNIQLPANPEWSFKLNDLVGNAVSRHDTLSVVRALYEVGGGHFSRFFVFLPCQNIYKKEEKGDSSAGQVQSRRMRCLFVLISMWSIRRGARMLP
jgi:hypothetical protein